MKKFLSNSKGTSTVEFALTIAFYLFIVMFIFEFFRLAIATAYWDLAIIESVRIAKNEQADEANYEKVFKQVLTEQKKFSDESTMGYLAMLDKNGFDVKVQYVDCPEETNCLQKLLEGKFRQPKQVGNSHIKIAENGRLATLARYSLTYDYQFVVPLPFIPKSWSEAVMNREFVVVQEFERSSFKPGKKKAS